MSYHLKELPWLWTQKYVYKISVWIKKQHTRYISNYKSVAISKDIYSLVTMKLNWILYGFVMLSERKVGIKSWLILPKSKLFEKKRFNHFKSFKTKPYLNQNIISNFSPKNTVLFPYLFHEIHVITKHIIMDGLEKIPDI